MNHFKFKVEILEEVKNFLDTLDEKAREKIIYNIWKARQVNDVEIFKKLTEDIWEFRTLYNRTHYRLLAFWDKSGNSETVVIATNGFVKKTNKTPKMEINKALSMKELYLKSKK